MRSAVFCYAAVDTDCARELASYLELNCSILVSLGEGRIEPGGDLLAVAGRALSADHPVLLLSPDSVAKLGNRGKWEPVLFEEADELGRQIAYVQVRSCKFPDLFRRRSFFDLSGQRLAGQRALRRWLLQHDPLLRRATNLDEIPQTSREVKELNELEPLLDGPGVRSGVAREIALAFAQAHVEDFEGVFWLNCAYRSRAGILGDAAHALGLSLRGRVEENAQRLREVCADHRLLLVFEHITLEDAAFIAAGEKTSFLFVTEQDSPAPASLEVTAAPFMAWQNQSEACLRSLGAANWHVKNLKTYRGDEWRTAASLGSSAASFLQDWGRLAEAYEILEMTREALRTRGDPFNATRVNWEMSWIREEWGETEFPSTRITTPEPPLQLSLALGE